MLEKLHIASKIIASLAILYFLWEYISSLIGISLVANQDMKPTSFKEMMVKASLKANPERLEKAYKDNRRNFYIAVILSIVLWIIW